jgi:hypothetical protein
MGISAMLLQGQPSHMQLLNVHARLTNCPTVLQWEPHQEVVETSQSACEQQPQKSAALPDVCIIQGVCCVLLCPGCY